MCGLAGYNISSKTAEKYLQGKEGVQKDILRKAWLHNLHRGIDACGYVGQTLSHETDWYKRTGTAVDALVNEVDADAFVIEPMKVFAAHTRAATGDADPKFSFNNHPVQYGGWHVTHNGHINNAIVLRNKHTTAKEKKGWPDVDSAVIPLMLAKNMDNAYDYQGLYDACLDLHGNFAFHAMHENFPGVSVIARGTGRPLTVAMLDGSVFAYGSEPESVWSMIHTMGINPNKKFDWFSLDQEHFLIVEDGRLIEWGAIRKSYSSTTKRQLTKRWLPREDGRKRNLVYKEDENHAWVNAKQARTIRGIEDGAQLLYTRKDGFTDEAKAGFPFDGDAPLGAKLSEADQIWLFDDMIHAIFGTVELVIDERSKLLKDVFNHALPFSIGQRFEVKKKKESLFKNGIPSAGLAKEDFLRIKTTDIKTAEIPEAESEYAYVTIQREEKAKHQKKSQAASMGKGSAPAKTTGDTDTTYEEDDETYVPEIIAPSLKLDWHNIFEETVPHEWEELFFLENRKCPTHDVFFTEHADFDDCPIVMFALTYAWAACTDMNLYNAWTPSVDIDSLMEDGNCDSKDGPPCQWIPAELVKVTNTHTSWYVRVSEWCKVCQSFRTLRDEPDWWKKLPISDRLSVYPTLELDYAN